MYAVRAAQVFDGTGFLAGGATVLVEEGRIAGVEPFGCDLPHECEVTTFTGTLLPGLIDTQVHLVTDGGPAALDRVAGCTEEELDTVRPGDQPLGASGRLEAVLEQAVRMVLDGVATSDPSGH